MRPLVVALLLALGLLCCFRGPGPMPSAGSASPAPEAAGIRTSDQFIDAWRRRVAAGRGSVPALALYDAAKNKKTPEAFSACVTRAARDDDAWGEGVCSLELYENVDVPPLTFEQAERWTRRGGELARRLLGHERGPYAMSLNNLALLAKLQGKYAQARPLYERALAINEAALGPEHPEVANNANNLGTLLHEMGDLRAARQALERALAIREKSLGPEHRLVAQSLNNLGLLLRDLGDVAAARPLLERAIAVWEKAAGPDDPGVADALGNLALLLQDLGDYQGARRHQARALAIYERAFGPDHSAVADGLNNLAGSLQQLGQLEAAYPLQQRALAINERILGPDHPMVATNLDNLAYVLKGLGRLREARPLYERALALRERKLGPDHPDVARSQHHLAFVLVDLGETRRAQALLERAVAIWEKSLGAEHPQVASGLASLALFLHQRGDLVRARELAARAMQIRKTYFHRVLGATSEREKVLALQNGGDASVAFSLAAAIGTEDAARWALGLALDVKGRAFDALAGQRDALAKRLDPASQRLFSEIRAIRAQLAVSVLHPEALKVPKAARDLETHLEELEIALARQSAAFSAERTAQRVTPAVVCAALPAGAALIETAVYTRTRLAPTTREERLLALLVRPPDCSVRLVDLGPTGPIVDAISAWRAQITRGGGAPSPRGLRVVAAEAGGGGSQRDPGRRVRDLVLGPLLPHLKDVRHLYIVPDGPLHVVPFAALPNRAGRFLVEDYTISVLTSGKDLVRPLANRGQVVLALGAPSFGASPEAVATAALRGLKERCPDFARAEWNELPETEAEVRAVAASSPGAVVLTHEQATLEAFRTQTPGKGLLHIATHGYFVSERCRKPGINPLLLSGLVLADGGPARRAQYLTALEVSGMDLSSAELVVLSACETGLGEIRSGEGVFGLQRAFLLAGAHNLVLSLFKVPSVETTALMADFYARRREGLGAAEALRRAQIDQIAGLRAQGRAAEPLLWAGFIAVGR